MASSIPQQVSTTCGLRVVKLLILVRSKPERCGQWQLQLYHHEARWRRRMSSSAVNSRCKMIHSGETGWVRIRPVFRLSTYRHSGLARYRVLYICSLEPLDTGHTRLKLSTSSFHSEVGNASETPLPTTVTQRQPTPAATSR